MKKFILLFSVFVASVSWASVKPQLFFTNGWVFDQICAQRTGFKIDPAWGQELQSRLGEFQKAWDDEAGGLIGATEKVAGKNFVRSEYTVTLSVCNFLPMSDPFLVNMLPYLNSSARGGQSRSRLSLVDLVYHELLHNFLVDNLKGWPTPLLEKYKNEGGSVLAHLHLMALQKTVYEKMKRPDLLAEADAMYKLIGGAYARSWRIVTEIEGAEGFLAEIRQ